MKNLNFYHRFLKPRKIIYWSQYGEDLVLLSMLKDVDRGFYVDVGAMHPKYESVTKLFYDRGSRGINLEPRISGH